MTTTPRLALPYYTDGQTAPQGTLSEQLNILDFWAAPYVDGWEETTPPGSPSDGDAYLVGASATGAWSGQDGSIAIYFSGWYFYAPKDGMRIWRRDASVSGNRGFFAYSDYEDDWYPDGWRWKTTTEHWTGRYAGEAGGITTNVKLVYAKVIEISAFPNGSNVITSYGGGLTIDLDYPVLHELYAAHAGTNILPISAPVGGLPIDVVFRASNFDLVTSLPMGSYKGSLYLEYCKDS